MALNYGDYYVHTVHKGSQDYVVRDSIAEAAINTIQGTGEGSIIKAKADIIGSAGDSGAADTIKGAKKYADSLASNYDASGAAAAVKSEVIGSTGDSGAADTIKGAKKYADSLASNYDASGAAATAKSEVIGTASDTGAADTVYGAKAYADTKIGNIGDTDVKSYVDSAVNTLAGEDWSQNAKTVKAIIDELSETGNADFTTVVDKVRGDFTYGATGSETTDIKSYIDGKVGDAVTGGTTISNGVLTLG